MTSARPVVHRTVPQGTWYQIPLPSGWTSVQLLFTGVPSRCEEVNCAAQASSQHVLTNAEIAAQCPTSSESRDLSAREEPYFTSACVHLDDTASSCTEDVQLSPTTQVV